MLIQNQLESLRSVCRVRLHDGKLLIRQFARFEKDRIGNSHLADIV
jgi:hypothetical protein